jgi:hypothetical protein
MNKHSKKFFDFINELHEKNLPYVIFRGFGKLPKMPDKDIDMLGSLESYDDILKSASKYLVKNNKICGDINYGFAEWCDMLLNPYFTSLERESWLPDGDKGLGYFRIDLQNSLYFKSPYNDFKTFWTVSKKFNDYVLENRIKQNTDITYYIPSVECEITLLILRDTLDKNRKWKDKHISRINELLELSDKSELIRCIEMVLPESNNIVEYLFDGKFNLINKIIDG